jgi:hypothetical protein
MSKSDKTCIIHPVLKLDGKKTKTFDLFDHSKSIASFYWNNQIIDADAVRFVLQSICKVEGSDDLCSFMFDIICKCVTDERTLGEVIDEIEKQQKEPEFIEGITGLDKNDIPIIYHPAPGYSDETGHIEECALKLYNLSIDQLFALIIWTYWRIPLFSHCTEGTSDSIKDLKLYEMALILPLNLIQELDKTAVTFETYGKIRTKAKPTAPTASLRERQLKVFDTYYEDLEETPMIPQLSRLMEPVLDFRV